MTAETLIDNATHTVLSFRRNRYDAWRNTATGAILFSGRLSLDCGHVYTWHPRCAEAMPVRGNRETCGECVSAALKAYAAQNTPAN